MGDNIRNQLLQNVFWKFPWCPNNIMEYYMNRLDQISLSCNIKWNPSIITEGHLLSQSNGMIDYVEKRIDLIDADHNAKYQPDAIRINHLFMDWMDVILYDRYFDAARKKQKR